MVCVTVPVPIDMLRKLLKEVESSFEYLSDDPRHPRLLELGHLITDGYELLEGTADADNHDSEPVTSSSG